MIPKLGVVGLNHGYVLANAIAASDTVQLAGVCTGTPLKHRAQTDRLHVPVYDQLDSMLADLELDGVVIAAPTDQLVPMAKRCLDRNISVLIEKPGGKSVADVMDLREAAAGSTAHVVVGYYRRLARQVVTLRELLAARIIGDVTGVSCTWVIQKPPGYFKSWKASRARGGGCLMINVIHDLDMLQELLGPIRTVAALQSGRLPTDDLEHRVALSLEFAGGGLGSIQLSDLSPSPYSYDNTVAAVTKFPQYGVDSHHFFGSRGSLAFPSFTVYSSASTDGSWFEVLNKTLAADSNESVDDPIAVQIERFGRVLCGKEKPHATLDDAIRNLAVVEAIRRSLDDSTVESVRFPTQR